MSADSVIPAQKVTVSSGTTLLKTRLFANEKIVAEFTEKPVGICCWSGGVVRTVQLTTHRLNYSVAYRQSWRCCCPPSPPALRQVFIKDISEIIVDNNQRVAETLAVLLFDSIFSFGCPATGIFLLIEGIAYEIDMFIGIGAAMIAIGVIANIFRLRRARASAIIFGTRCQQFSPFAITLASASDRIQLLEEVSALIAKRQ